MLVTGTFTYTNNIIAEYYVEHAVALLDMYGFVTRNQNWELPVDSQVLGYLKLNAAQHDGTFRLQLPAQPAGTPVKLGTSAHGVQVFAVAYSPNLAGGPFAEGDDRSRGWPSYLASTVNDPEQNDEVTGGKLIIWAPDAQEQFPTGFGADHKLFTPDDTLGPVPQGYSVVDLDQQPFKLIRTPQVQLTLNEPNDAAVKDYSKGSYTQAFAQLFERVRTEYAFNGVPGKQVDYEALRREIEPRIAKAEQQHDAQAYYVALRDFTQAFKDGHVGINDGGRFEQRVFQQRYGGGYGFAIRELDDGRVIVTYVSSNGPAAKAGITEGATITAFNNTPITQALRAVVPGNGPFSTDFARQYQQQRFLLRAPQGTDARVTFRNTTGTAQTATLRAIAEDDSFQITDPFSNHNPAALPVEYNVLPGGTGYVRVNSNYDDLNLVIRLWERALRTFQQFQLKNVIIDLRRNSGGASLGLASYLTDHEIEMGQLEYYSTATGKFEARGTPDRITPSEEQFHFSKLALLVDQSCYSACELEAYGLSQVPGIAVIGQYPTAGVEAEVARGQFQMPEGISMQFPTGRFVKNGEIFLEGKGVQPTVRILVDEQTASVRSDTVLQRAEQALQK